MASIRKLPSGRYRLRWRDAQDREHGQTFDRKKEAQARLAQVEVEHQRGVYRDPRAGRVSLGEYAAGIVEDADLRPATRALYRTHLARYIDPHLGGIALQDLTRERVRGFYGTLGRAGVGKATIAAVHRLLSKMLNAAVEDDLIPKNVARGVTAGKVARKPLVLLTPEDVENIAEAMWLNPYSRDYAPMVYVAAYCGLRFGEVAALRPSRVHLDRGVIEVVEAVTEVAGKVTIGPTKTDTPRPMIPIGPTLARVLGQAIADARARHPDEDDPLIWTAPGGGLLLRTSFRKRYWLPALDGAGFDVNMAWFLEQPLPRFHDLRHFAAAQGIVQGAHARVIQERLGHASYKTTMDVYGALDPRMGRELAARLDDVLASVARTWHEDDPEAEQQG